MVPRKRKKIGENPDYILIQETPEFSEICPGGGLHSTSDLQANIRAMAARVSVITGPMFAGGNFIWCDEKLDEIGEGEDHL